MRTIDFSPFTAPSAGFDRLADLLDSATADGAATGYPPYNIERYRTRTPTASRSRVAGFRPEELNIEVKRFLLTATGRCGRSMLEPRRFLHRGLATNGISSASSSSPTMLIVTKAALADGLLSIALKRELPEALKPRAHRNRGRPAQPDRRRKGAA